MREKRLTKAERKRIYNERKQRKNPTKKQWSV